MDEFGAPESANETLCAEGAGAGQDPALHAEIGALIGEVKAFHEDTSRRLDMQEKRMGMIRRAPRAPLAAAEAPEASHQGAFDAYVRHGDEDALRGLGLEGKSLSTAVAADGGYLVDPVTSETVAQVLSGAGSIRSIASVVNVEATSYDVLIDHTGFGAGWASETGPQTETGTGRIDRISIPLHELSALPKASQRLLDDAAFDIEAWLAGRIAERFATAEAAAFVSGDGVDKPRGFLDHQTSAQGAWAWGTLEAIPTGAAGAFGSVDALVDVVYALGARYRANGSFVMNSKTAGEVRKLKDADGRFLWSDGLAAGEPARLLGYPVVIAEDMPDIAPGAKAIAFGDFAAGYTIAERPDLRVLRDPFSAKPNVLFYATKRVGGDVTDFAAIKLLSFEV